MSARLFAALLVLTVATNAWFLGDAGEGFPLDDSWVHMVYARSFAQLQGFAFNPGQWESGVTAPLWTMLAAVPEALTRWLGSARPDTAMRWMGALFGLLTAWAGFRLTSRAGRWPAIFAALLLTVEPLMVYGRFSGMELPLFGFLSLVLIEAVLDNRTTRAAWLAGLLVLTRPEALVLAVPALVFLGRRQGRVWSCVWPLVLCLGPWVAYCWMVSGRPFPNTVAMKGGLVADPVELTRVTLALLRDTGWSWALPIAVVAGTISLNGGSRLLGTFLALTGVLLLFTVLVSRPMPLDARGVVPFYWQRYALLCWPPLVVVASAGLGSLVRTAWAGLFCRPVAAAVLIGPLLVVLISARQFPAHGAELRQRFADQCADVEALNVQAGLWIRHNTTRDVLVATHDAGAVKYFGQRRVLDTWGNNDSQLADLLWRGDHAGAAEFLLNRRPQVLVALPLLYAVSQAQPELQRLRAEWADEPGRFEAWYADLQARADDQALAFGLTHRAVTFHVDHPSTIDDPVHRDLVIFTRP